MFFLNVLIGFLGGVFGGLGMGGGTILIPLLSIFGGVEQKMAQGINLLAFVVMSIISILIHIKNGYISTKGLFPLVFGGVVFSIIGALIVTRCPSNVLSLLFGIFLCILAVFEFIKLFKR